MEADRQEVVAKVAGEASVEGVVVVAGWEVTVPDLALVAIVSALVAERDCPTKSGNPVITQVVPSVE